MLHQQALTYISQQLAKGVPRDAIRTNLLSRGWESQDVDDALAAVVVTSGAQAGSSSVPMPTITVVQANKGGYSIWKIVGIVLLVIIAPFALFLAFGFYLLFTGV